MSEELCKLLRARPFSFPSSLTKDPSKARRRRLDICRHLGGPAWSLKRSSDLSALIDGHKPPGSTPHVGKEVPPSKVPFHMLILGYKYSRGATSSKEPIRKGSDPLPECLLPIPSSRHPGRAGWITMTAAATPGGTHKLASTKEERKVGPPRTPAPMHA